MYIVCVSTAHISTKTFKIKDEALRYAEEVCKYADVRLIIVNNTVEVKIVKED